MLPLDSPRWSELKHAYGSAENIPSLLKQLDSLPRSEGDSDPWFSLWSALAHQGDVYSASFAAVPYVVNALALSPSTADFGYFQFPAWVEVCRCKKSVPIPDDLIPEYFEALSQLPLLVAAASSRPWDEALLSCALSAIAAAKDQPAVAEAALELSPEVAKDFLQWFRDR